MKPVGLVASPRSLSLHSIGQKETKKKMPAELIRISDAPPMKGLVARLRLPRQVSAAFNVSCRCGEEKPNEAPLAIFCRSPPPPSSSPSSPPPPPPLCLSIQSLRGATCVCVRERRSSFQATNTSASERRLLRHKAQPPRHPSPPPPFSFSASSSSSPSDLLIYSGTAAQKRGERRTGG